MALELPINADDNFSAVADKVSNALRDIAAEEDKLLRISTKLGKSQKDVAQAMQRIGTAEAKAAAEVKQAAAKQQAADAKQIAHNKKLQKEIKKGVYEIIGFTAAITAATAASAALGYKVADLAMKAGDARKASVAMVGSWTGGDGERSLKLLDTMAGKLGQSVGVVREEFVKFREAGLSNKLALHLIKLRADLVATGLSAEQADAAITPVLSAKTNAGRAEYIKQIAAAFHVAGDGAAAAKASVTSVSGALASMDNTKTKVLEQIWTKIEPAVSGAAQKLATFFAEFADSKEGQAVLDSLGNAIVTVANDVGRLTDYWKENASTISGVFSTSINVAAALVDGLTHPLDSLGESFKWVAANVDMLNGLTINDMAEAFGIAKRAVTDAYDYMAKLLPKFYAFGKDIVIGIVDGITSKVSAVMDSARELASKVTTPFKDALGIKSPSKVFEGYGQQTVAGYEIGQQRAIQQSGGAMPLEAAAVRAPAGYSAPAMASGGGEVSIHIDAININGADVNNVSDIAARVRDELQRQLGNVFLARGYATT